MKTPTSIPRQAVRALVGSALLIASGTALGCRGDRTNKPPRQFIPDMDQQPKLKPQSESAFFEDGRAQRPMVDRTVPFGSRPQLPEQIADEAWGAAIETDRSRMLKADRTYSFGLVAGSTPDAPVYAAYMPVGVTPELIARGQERFDIYCSACHGYTGVGGQGVGAGTVGKLWSIPPANLLADQYRDRAGGLGSDGYLFHVIREGLWTPDGKNRMPAYGHSITEADAWAIVAYVRTLQAAHGVPFEQLDPADQARLQSAGGNP